MPPTYSEAPQLNTNSTLTTTGGSWDTNTMSKVNSTERMKPEPTKARTRKMSAPNEELTVMQTLFSKCLCSESKWMFSSPSSQIELVSLDGVECIALGAVTDEHSARERVELTVTLLATRTDRLINVGYLKQIQLPSNEKDRPLFENVAEVIPFEAWKENTARSSSNKADSHILPLDVGTVIEQIKVSRSYYVIIVMILNFSIAKQLRSSYIYTERNASSPT